MSSDVSGWRIVAWGGAALLLIVPWVAMQFTHEVHWTVGDFVFAGVLLFGSLGAYELIARTTQQTAYRVAVSLALLGAVLLLWVNGAVGIIGSENNDANLMYTGVLAVALIGAFVSRFDARGMARTMYATALTQALVAAIALVAGWGSEGHSWPRDIVGVTVIFVALWLASGRLFQTAADRESA